LDVGVLGRNVQVLLYIHHPKPENNTLEKETKHYKPPVLGFNMLILEGVEI